MAVRTYIPFILTAFKKLKDFLPEHSEKLKQYLGDGGFAAVTLVVDLCIVVASIINGGLPAPEEPMTDFNAIETLSSAQINQIQGAVDKFYATIGVTP